VPQTFCPQLDASSRASPPTRFIGSRSADIYDPATTVGLQRATPPDGNSGAAYSGFTLSGTGGSGSLIERDQSPHSKDCGEPGESD